MPGSIKNIVLSYIIGVLLAILILPVVKGIIATLPDIGWHFMTVMYLMIFFLQILFYYLTTNHNLLWTALSFVLNYILWVAEQVNIELAFSNSIIYQGDYSVFVLGGILWVTNKVILDKLFSLKKSIPKKISRIEIYSFKLK